MPNNPLAGTAAEGLVAVRTDIAHDQEMLDQALHTTAATDPSVAMYEGFLALDPTNPLLLTTLGDLHHAAGRLEQALDCYEKCLAAHPEHLVALGRIANVRISQQKFADAEQLIRRALDAGEPNGALLHNLGRTLYYQERWAEAGEAFRQARDQGLATPDSARYRAYALHHLGDVEHAIEVCEEWLARAPDDVAMNGYLSLLEMDGGQLLKARARAVQVLAREPDNTHAALVEGMWRTEQQETDEATLHFEKVIRVEPENPRGWLGMGLTHLHRGEHASAIAAFEQALVYMPDHVGTRVTLGWAHFVNRDLPRAERTFREAIATDGTFGEAHGGLAVALLFQERVEEAKRAARVARRLNPGGFGALWVRTTLLSLQGKREQGEAELAAALSRPFGSDGRSLFDHIQLFTREQAARSQAKTRALPAPPQDRPER